MSRRKLLPIGAAIVAAFFIGALPLFAATPARFDLPVLTTTAKDAPVGSLPYLAAVTNATVAICGYPAQMSAGMCTNTITTYTDATLADACPATAQLTPPGSSACTSTTGLQGSFGFWYDASQQIHMTYTVKTQWGTFGPYDIVPGATSGTGATLTPGGIQYGASSTSGTNATSAQIVAAMNASPTTQLVTALIPALPYLPTSGGTLTGALNAPAVNAVVNAALEPGATADAKIAAAIAALPSGGIVDARGFGATTQTLANSATITIPANTTLLCNPATNFNFTGTATAIFTITLGARASGCQVTISTTYAGAVWSFAGNLTVPVTILQNFTINGTNNTTATAVLMEATTGTDPITGVLVENGTIHGTNGIILSAATGAWVNSNFIRDIWTDQGPYALQFNSTGGSIENNSVNNFIYEYSYGSNTPHMVNAISLTTTQHDAVDFNRFTNLSLWDMPDNSTSINIGTGCAWNYFNGRVYGIVAEGSGAQYPNLLLNSAQFGGQPFDLQGINSGSTINAPTINVPHSGTDYEIDGDSVLSGDGGNIYLTPQSANGQVYLAAQDGNATSSANESGRRVLLNASFWNGTAAGNDWWYFQNILGSGANPTSTLTLVHGGSSGPATLDIQADVDLNSVSGPAAAPTGTCATNGQWELTQDGKITVCQSGTWTAFGGTGVTQITGPSSTVTGAMTFTGSGVSQSGNTFTFSGGSSGGGTVTSFSAGNLSPLFTSAVANPTTAPALSFSLSTQTANTVFAGPSSGSAAAPTFRALNIADIPSLSSLYLSLGGGTLTGPLTINGGSPQVAFTYNGTAIVPGSSTTAVYGVDSSGDAVVSEAGAAASRICTAGNGRCTPSSTGITVWTGTGWGTSYAGPTGGIVGTTDTQTLTNKTVDGVSPTTFGYLDPTSSVQTQLNAKAPLASPALTGTPTAPTATAGTNTTQIATTAFVQAALPTLVSSLGYTFGDAATGSALTTSEVGYITVPFACTITGWHIMADAGTVTVKVARVNGGTALPTLASNSISTNGVSLATGTKIDSTTVTDFTSTAISANDTLGFFITAVSTAKQITFQLDCSH